ncbi:MAG: hypothetical protein GY867_04395 [bacterium]|nr:hypothetical protein [bacterium]
MVDKNRRQKRPFVGVHFKCCNVYQRLYLNAAGTEFVGFCPKCMAKSIVRVSSSGSRSRFFNAE